MRDRIRSVRCIFAGEVNADLHASCLKQTGHAEGEFVCDDRAFAEPGPEEIAEVGDLIIKAPCGVGLVQFGLASVQVVDSGTERIPPVGVEEDVAARPAKQGIPVAEKVDPGVKLCHAMLVLGLEEGEVVDAGWTETAHTLHALHGPEPVEGEENFIGAYAEDASAAQFKEVQRVVWADGRVTVAGANEADGTDGVLFEVLAETPVEGKEGRLHGFHEEAIVTSGSGEDLIELADIESSRLFAENVLTGGEGAEAEVGMGIGVGGDVDGVDFRGEQGIERGCDQGYGMFFGVDAGAVGVATPDGREDGVRNGLKSLREAGCGAAWTDDAEADQLRGVGHGIRVARRAEFIGLAAY